MYCAYHPSNTARSQCSNCRRALCAGCDHRIKGYPYCQDCIVLGIQSLSDRQQTGRSRSSARVAAFFGMLLPGLGAVYNRQNVKALVHFLTVMVLFQFNRVGFLRGAFIAGGLAFYIYSILDAYRTAKLIAMGTDPVADEEQFKKRLVRRAPLLGLILIVAGSILAIQLLHPFGVPLFRFLPVGLILLGGYLLTSYFKRKRDGDYAVDDSERTRHAFVRGAFGEHSAAERVQTHAWRQR